MKGKRTERGMANMQSKKNRRAPAGSMREQAVIALPPVRLTAGKACSPPWKKVILPCGRPARATGICPEKREMAYLLQGTFHHSVFSRAERENGLMPGAAKKRNPMS